MMTIETPKSIAEWQSRMENTFVGSDGQFAPRISQIAEFERAHRRWAEQNLTGITRLLDAFQDFTVNVLETCPRENITKLGEKWGLLIAAFRRYRSSVNSFH